MAARGISSVKSQKISHGFTRALASALFEWLLIFMLFIDAIFSYLITKFSHYCGLQTPCLLCSRLDHVLGNEKLKYYWDLICGNHKLEISSLVYCHAHDKLVDVHGICESCLFSFATINKSNAETYRLLVGKLGEDSSFSFDEEPLLEGHNCAHSSMRHCSCCNEPFIPRGYARDLMQAKSGGSESAELDRSLQIAVGHRRSDKQSASVRATHQRNIGRHPLSHVEYRELKINSDTESEVAYSDDGEASALIRETEYPKDDHAVQCSQLEPRIVTLSDDFATEKLIDPACAPERSILISEGQSDAIKPHDGASLGSGGSESAELDMSLQIAVGHRRSDKQSASVRATHQRNIGLHPLSHVEYRALKINYDTESEVTYSDNGEASALIRETDYPKDDHAVQCSVQCSQLEPRIVTLSDYLATEKLIDPACAPEHSLLISEGQSDHGLEELNWQQINYKTDASALSELISLDDVPLLSNAGETPVDVSKEGKLISLDDSHPSLNVGESPLEVSKESKIVPLDDGETPVDVLKEGKLISLDDAPPLLNVSESPLEASKGSKIPPLDDVPSSYLSGSLLEVSEEGNIVSPDDAPPSSSSVESPVEASKESSPLSGVTRALEVGETTVTESDESFQAISGPITTETALETNLSSSDSSMLVPNALDLSDAYKLAVGNRGMQQSVVLAEQWTGKDSSKLGEDLKALLSQLSAARGIEQLLNDISPKMAVNSDELKTSDASSSNGMQLLQKMISLERNESSLSLDGSIISEIEGESEVDRLKRQIEHDRRLLSSLYKELEEERNASTVAVNQSMAMITRLQEEKATLHMEALQNLRMMEEQAEYDMEALQKTNDLLDEREKEIQDLEMELEFYRNKFPNELILENIVEPTRNLKARESEVDHSQVICVEERVGDPRNPVTEKPNTCNKVEETDMPFWDMNKGSVKNLLLGFEDERLYMLQCLEKLEKKLRLFSDNGIYSDLANGECSGNEGDGASDQKDFNCKGESQVNSDTDGNDLSMQNDVPALRGSPHGQGHVSSFENSQIIMMENSEFRSSGQSSPVLCRGTDIASLGNEVSNLNERLEALKADQNFLEHTINSLRNGEEGLQFIREIASHLQALRRIGIRRRDQAVA